MTIPRTTPPRSSTSAACSTVRAPRSVSAARMGAGIAAVSDPALVLAALSGGRRARAATRRRPGRFADRIGATGLGPRAPSSDRRRPIRRARSLAAAPEHRPAALRHGSGRHRRAAVGREAVPTLARPRADARRRCPRSSPLARPASCRRRTRARRFRRRAPVNLARPAEFNAAGRAFSPSSRSYGETRNRQRGGRSAAARVERAGARGLTIRWDWPGGRRR